MKIKGYIGESKSGKTYLLKKELYKLPKATKKVIFCHKNDYKEFKDSFFVSLNDDTSLYYFDIFSNKNNSHKIAEFVISQYLDKDVNEYNFLINYVNELIQKSDSIYEIIASLSKNFTNTTDYFYKEPELLKNVLDFFTEYEMIMKYKEPFNLNEYLTTDRSYPLFIESDFTINSLVLNVLLSELAQIQLEKPLVLVLESEIVHLILNPSLKPFENKPITLYFTVRFISKRKKTLFDSYCSDTLLINFSNFTDTYTKNYIFSLLNNENKEKLENITNKKEFTKFDMKEQF